MSKETNIQNKNKGLIVEQLKKAPIIQLACEKLGVARATFYRWRKKDKKFARKVDEAILEGSQLVNEMAESQLINSIKEGNMTGIIFWLKNNHKNYANKLELSGKIKTEIDKLTPEQEENILRALELASLISKDNINKANKLGGKK